MYNSSLQKCKQVTHWLLLESRLCHKWLLISHSIISAGQRYLLFWLWLHKSGLSSKFPRYRKRTVWKTYWKQRWLKTNQSKLAFMMLGVLLEKLVWNLLVTFLDTVRRWEGSALQMIRFLIVSFSLRYIVLHKALPPGGGRERDRV